MVRPCPSLLALIRLSSLGYTIAHARRIPRGLFFRFSPSYSSILRHAGYLGLIDALSTCICPCTCPCTCLHACPCTHLCAFLCTRLHTFLHVFTHVDAQEWKLDTLCDLYETLTIRQAIVFCNTRWVYRHVCRHVHRHMYINA